MWCVNLLIKLDTHIGRETKITSFSRGRQLQFLMLPFWPSPGRLRQSGEKCGPPWMINLQTVIKVPETEETAWMSSKRFKLRRKKSSWHDPQSQLLPDTIDQQANGHRKGEMKENKRRKTIKKAPFNFMWLLRRISQPSNLPSWWCVSKWIIYQLIDWGLIALKETL